MHKPKTKQTINYKPSCSKLVLIGLTSLISAKRFVSFSTRPRWAWTLSLTSIFLLSISSSFALNIARTDLDISSSLSSLLGLWLLLIIPEFFPFCCCCCWSCDRFGVAIAASTNHNSQHTFPLSLSLPSFLCSSLLFFWNDNSLSPLP